MKKKFDLYYDDSSSEEDEEREFNNYSNRKLKSGKQQTHENLKKNLGYKYKSDDVNFKKNIDLSFIVHELAINLIKSPIIGKKYFTLKKKFLSDNQVPTDIQMKEAVKKAVQSILTMEVTENKINEYVNYLVKDSRKLLKSLNSDDLSYLYPYKNPLGLPIKKQKITENKLLLELQNIYKDKDLQITHKITHKVPKKVIYQAKNYNDLFSYKPTTSMTKFLKFKLLEQNSKMTVQEFISTIIDSNEIQSAIDTNHDKFRSELLRSINQSLQEENKKHTNRATLEKHFSYETDSIDDYDSAHQLIALGRLMTTSIKRSYKNAQEQQSLLDNTQKSFFRKISLSNVELMETQLLYTNSGSRTDYVEIETQGNSGAYKNIAMTIENIKQKLNITDKQIAQWIRKTFKGEAEIYASLESIKAGQKEELGEFITALTYLLFSTEAVRNPASLIIHQMMLDLITQNKLTFLSAFTHLENICSSKI